MGDSGKGEYSIVYNIPEDYRVKDLRVFFSTFIETSKFRVFHYLGRAQAFQNDLNKKFKCCVVQTTISSLQFQERYHNRSWESQEGAYLADKCLICGPISYSELHPRKKDLHQSDIYQSLEDHLFSSHKRKYRSRLERKNDIRNGNFDCLLELEPPVGLPNGNIGTPIAVIREMIKNCVLPPALLQSLGVHEIDTVYRKYGKVYYLHPDHQIGGSSATSQIHPTVQYCVSEARTMEENCGQKELPGDECMDGEELVTLRATDNQQHHEEPLFENEMEVTWDKGSSGLVFYTDACYWDREKGDLDERCADDFDVSDEEEPRNIPFTRNFSREDEKRREDHRRCYNRKFISTELERSIGYQLLLRSGWTVGKGLGKKENGLPNIIQVPFAEGNAGLGSYEEEREISEPSPQAVCPQEESYKISTIYDNNASKDFKYRKEFLCRKRKKRQVEKQATTTVPYILTSNPIRFVKSTPLIT